VTDYYRQLIAAGATPDEAERSDYLNQMLWLVNRELEKAATELDRRIYAAGEVA